LGKVKGLPELERREIVAGIHNYRMSAPMTSAADKALGAAHPGWEATAQEAMEGGLGFKNPLDISKVSAGDITDDALSKLLAKRTLATGEIISVVSLKKKFSKQLFGTANFKSLTSVQKEKVYDVIRGYFPVTGTARWALGTKEAGYNFFKRIMPGGGVPARPADIQLGRPLNEEAFAAQQQIERRARDVVVKRGPTSASAYYGPTRRSAARSAGSRLKRDAKRLQRTRGREAMKVQEALMPDRPMAVPVGQPYGPSPVDLAPVRRMRRMAREATAPGTGRGAAQASTALTAANQAIKESALLPDIVRPELLVPKGKLRVDFRPFDLTDDLLGKYQGTTKGIDVMVGGKVLGKVPYTKGGGLINKILGAKSVSGFIEEQGVLQGGQPWAKMTILPETGPGKVIPVRNVRVAGITFGEVVGSGERGAAKAAGRQARMEGSQALKKWMSKVPTRYKVGAGIIGVAAGAMLLNKMGKRRPEILEGGENPDASLYGGARASMMAPEGMDEGMYGERIRERMETPVSPMSYSARIDDPNSIQTNIRIRGRTKRQTDFEAVGRGIGLVASERSGAELGNVNVRVTDDSRKMSDEYIDRRLARLM